MESRNSVIMLFKLLLFLFFAFIATSVQVQVVRIDRLEY